MAQTLSIPRRGINRGMAVVETPSEYSSEMNNVRTRDVLEGKLRLGQRPGLQKWGSGTLIGGTNLPIVAMCSVSRAV